MRKSKTAKAPVAVMLVAAISTAGTVFGAGPAAAPSSGGGGGGHASAPAAAAPAAHASAPAASAAPAQHVESTAKAPAPAQSQNHSATASNNTNRVAKAQTGQQTHRRDDQHYQNVYGSPWWPNAVGWNSGWYGNGYGSGGYYNDPSYGLTSNANTNAAPAQNNDVTPSPSDPSLDANRPTAAAQAQNAVNHSPAITTLNDDVQHAQADFDADRERVLLNLRNNPNYQKAVASRKNAAQNVRSTTQPAVNGAPALAMLDAATAKLNAADDVTKMEEQAVAADPKAAADKDRLTGLVAQRDAAEAQIRGH